MNFVVSEDHARESTSVSPPDPLRSLEVRMFDVGPGELILITFPDMSAWVIDGGVAKRGKKPEALGRELAEYFRSNGIQLSALVASHPHEDHLNAIPYFLENDPPHVTGVKYYHNGATGEDIDEDWFEPYEESLRKNYIQKVAVNNRRLPRIELGDWISADLLSGRPDSNKDYQSVLLILRFGAARLLFTGDCECSYENDLLDEHDSQTFRADVLKVTHHGSSSGTGFRLLEAVRPGIAISSSSTDSKHRLESDVRYRLLHDRNKRKLDRQVFQTLREGDIVLHTDGSRSGGGVVYQVESESPGRWRDILGVSKKQKRKKQDKKKRKQKHEACLS